MLKLNGKKKLQRYVKNIMLELLEEISFIPDIDFDREEEDIFEYEFDKWLEKMDYIQMIRKGGYNRNKREFIRLDKETINYYKKNKRKIL